MHCSLPDLACGIFSNSEESGNTSKSIASAQAQRIARNLLHPRDGSKARLRCIAPLRPAVDATQKIDPFVGVIRQDVIPDLNLSQEPLHHTEPDRSGCRPFVRIGSAEQFLHLVIRQVGRELASFVGNYIPFYPTGDLSESLSFLKLNVSVADFGRERSSRPQLTRGGATGILCFGCATLWWNSDQNWLAARNGRTPMPKQVHIVPRDDGWAVRREGAKRDSSHHDTQNEAFNAGRNTAQREKAEVLIHRPDGTIRDRNSYGNDPRRRKG